MSSEQRNGVLARLPASERALVLAQGSVTQDAARERMIGRLDPIEWLYFPLSGMVSIVTSDATGASVEVVSIGREGVVGVGAIFGDRSLPFDAFWQLDGEALRVGVEGIRSTASSLPVLYSLAARYLSSLLVQAGQNGACNRIHDMQQRSAKWLLLSHDRREDELLDLTQEFFATMLGVSRPKLSRVERTLRDHGLISDRRRGKIMILDRVGLEKMTCECYWIIRDELDHMFEDDALHGESGQARARPPGVANTVETAPRPWGS